MAVSSIGCAAARHLARVLVELEVLEHEPARLRLGEPACGAGSMRMRATSSSRLNGLVT